MASRFPGTGLRRRARDGLDHARRAAKFYGLSQRLKRGVAQRRARYAGVDLGFGSRRVGDRGVGEAIEALERDGYVLLRGVFDPAGLAQVAAEMESARAAGRTIPIFRGIREPGLPRFLTPEEAARGEEYVAPRAYFVYIDRPFVACPSSLRYVFSDEVIDLAAAAYGCPPMLVAGKIMRTYCNDLPLIDPFIFHYDDQATRIVKFFLYLSDVDEESGPFCYVRGSARRKPRACRRKIFWTDEEMEEFYGADAIRYVTARAGDLIVADTSGFHKATKPRRTEREMLLITSGVHAFPGPVHLPAGSLEGLGPKQRAMADWAEIA